MAEQKLNWLLVDLNSYFASCEQQDNPQLRGKPIAVVAMLTDSTGVLAASYQAKKFGIKTNTRVSDARKMCPGIQFVETHHRRYLEYHERIIQAVEEVIPIDAVLSIDEMSCELTGSQQSLEKAISIAQRVKNNIREKVGECLTSSIGLGANTLIAKMASDMQKPDGLVWITQSEITEKLGPLSVRDIPGVGAAMQYRLNSLGYFKVSDLLKISEAQARSVWGSVVGAKVLQALKGGDYKFEKGQTKSIGHEHVLPPDLRSHDKALVVATKLLNKAVVRLRENGFLCEKLNIFVRFVDGTQFENEIKFSATHDTGLLLKFLHKMWKFSSAKKPLKVSVVLSRLTKNDERQLSFFDPVTARREKAYAVADLINKKFGSNIVQVADLLGTKDQAKGGIAFSRVPKKEEF